MVNEPKIETDIVIDDYVNVIDHNFTPSTLGKGYFGEVFQTKLKTQDAPVAVKKIDKDYPYIPSEIYVCFKIKSLGGYTNVIKFLGCAQDMAFRYLFFELAQMTLSTYLDKNTHENRKPNICKDYALGAISALIFLREHLIYHGDVKPDNILIVEGPESTSTLKLCDFGISHVDPHAQRIIVDINKDTKGLSTILYLLLTDDESKTDVSGNLLSCNVSPGVYTDFAPLRDVIKKGWDKNSDLRPHLLMYKAAAESPEATFANKRKYKV